MESTESTFDIIMKSSPFLKGVINAKIAEEVAKKDVTINELQALSEKLTVSNEELKVRADTSDRVSADASATQQELIELLIEKEVI